MSKDSNNLEDFFRNSLKNYSENPRNDLWDSIEANIPPKPSRKLRPAYILLALLLFLLVGFGYEFFQFKNQIVAVNDTVINQKEELNELKKELETVKGQLEVASQTDIDETKLSNNDDDSDGLATNNVSVLTKKATNAKTTTIGKRNLVENAIPIVQNEEPVEVEKEIATKPLASRNATQSLDFITSKEFELDQNDLQLSLLEPSPKTKAGKTLSAEMFTSVFRAFPNNSGDKAQVNKWKPSFDFGGLINLGLNDHWDIQIGVGYSKMILNDAVYAELNYAREELDQARGTYTSVYDYSVNTPSGEIMVNTLLSNQRINDGRDLQEGDPFKLGLQYQNELQYFQLPVFVRYKVGKGRYRFTIRSGIIQKFLLDETIKLSSVDPELDRLQNDKTNISSGENAVRTTSMDVLFGIGGEYRISRRNSLHLSSNFAYSLQEIYPETKPFSIGIQLGIQHKLGK